MSQRCPHKSNSYDADAGPFYIVLLPDSLIAAPRATHDGKWQPELFLSSCAISHFLATAFSL